MSRELQASQEKGTHVSELKIQLLKGGNETLFANLHEEWPVRVEIGFLESRSPAFRNRETIGRFLLIDVGLLPRP